MPLSSGTDVAVRFQEDLISMKSWNPRGRIRHRFKAKAKAKAKA